MEWAGRKSWVNEFCYAGRKGGKERRRESWVGLEREGEEKVLLFFRAQTTFEFKQSFKFGCYILFEVLQLLISQATKLVYNNWKRNNITLYFALTVTKATKIR